MEPSSRGSGIHWGPDVTANYLDSHGLSLLIRSHEMIDEGYRIGHNSKCVTLFSASYYCGTNQNKVIIIF